MGSRGNVSESAVEYTDGLFGMKRAVSTVSVYINISYITHTMVLLGNKLYSLGPRGVYLALGSIQCFILVSIAPESSDSKSARCQAVTPWKIELFT